MGTINKTTLVLDYVWDRETWRYRFSTENQSEAEALIKDRLPKNALVVGLSEANVHPIDKIRRVTLFASGPASHCSRCIRVIWSEMDWTRVVYVDVPDFVVDNTERLAVAEAFTIRWFKESGYFGGKSIPGSVIIQTSIPYLRNLVDPSQSSRGFSDALIAHTRSLFFDIDPSQIQFDAEASTILQYPLQHGAATGIIYATQDPCPQIEISGIGNITVTRHSVQRFIFRAKVVGNKWLVPGAIEQMARCLSNEHTYRAEIDDKLKVRHSIVYGTNAMLLANERKGIVFVLVKNAQHQYDLVTAITKIEVIDRQGCRKFIGL